MKIDKILIENFKCFKGQVPIEFNDGVNILVGNNEAGKSTILEAIHLTLTGMLNGRYLRNELSQYLFNKDIEQEYIDSLKTDNPLAPPHISIEIFVSGEDCPPLAELEGNDNSDESKNSGIKYRIEFNTAYQGEYEELIKGGDVLTIPIEFYKVRWSAFAREAVTAKSIPIKSALIDSSSARFRNGSDIYIAKIIRDNLEDKDKVELSQVHRQLKEKFMEEDSVKAINKKINDNASISNKSLEISVDLSTQNAWETSLMTYLEKVPFHYIGKGEQSIIKTALALSHKKSQEASLLLIEEPENHLSHTKLNELLVRISKSGTGKQIIISTHNSFVANKLGLKNLILLNDLKTTKLDDLKPETQSFFEKLSGYDTLRLVLCEKAILVEGDSDELVVQRAYMDNNNGQLPIQDGVDVISVGISFLRFLEIAEKINKRVDVVTDNDGKLEALKKKYANYLGDNKKDNINILFDETVGAGNLVDFNYNTLEPKILDANNREILNKVFGKNLSTDNELLIHMRANKTKCALKIFDTTETIEFPAYISNAVKQDDDS